MLARLKRYPRHRRVFYTPIWFRPVSRMIIIDGRGAATPEDEKVFVDLERRCSGDCMCEQVKGRGLIGGLTPNDNLTRRRLTYT
jgi:hypothetical protein